MVSYDEFYASFRPPKVRTATIAFSFKTKHPVIPMFFVVKSLGTLLQKLTNSHIPSPFPTCIIIIVVTIIGQLHAHNTYSFEAPFTSRIILGSFTIAWQGGEWPKQSDITFILIQSKIHEFAIFCAWFCWVSQECIATIVDCYKNCKLLLLDSFLKWLAASLKKLFVSFVHKRTHFFCPCV